MNHLTKSLSLAVLVAAMVAMSACGGGGSGGSSSGGDEGGGTAEEGGSDGSGDGDGGGDSGGDEGGGSGDGGGGGTGDDGDGGASGPGTPTLSLTPQSIKTFHFTWDDIDGETEYRLLENPDDISGYTEVATIAADNTSHDLEVFLPARINASYMLQACNGDGCTDSSPVHVDGNLAAAVGYVKASNTEERDDFGSSVALSADGQTFAVGAPGEDSAANSPGGAEDNDNLDGISSGAVFVFIRDADGWRQQGYLKASNNGVHDEFGHSVTLSADGSTVAVGVIDEDSSATGIDGNQADDSAAESGAAYVFTRSGESWSQQAYIKASNTGAGDGFGYSIALAGDGDTLAVGTPYEDGNATGINSGDQADDSVENSGAVYVFTRNGTDWAQQAYVKASNTGPDAFGGSVALTADGDTLAVGAAGEDGSGTGVNNGNQGDDSAESSGAVYVFRRSGTDWTQRAYVKASNTEAVDVFGRTVALTANGDTLAVGAPGEDSSATGVNGAEGNDFSNGSGSGAVYVFTHDGAGWSQQAYVKASNTSYGLDFGYSIALAADGDTLAVGTPRENSNATGIGGNDLDESANANGAVYVFARDSGVWGQQAYVKASNAGEVDWFGYRMALGDSGNIMAVGAYREDSNATGIDGDQTDNSTTDSGAVYLY